MQTATNQNFTTLEQLAAAGIATPETAAVHDWDDSNFPPLELVTRPTVPTDAAAHYLNRKPQTLRAWACLENGALRPVARINGRLAWPVAAIRALLEGGAK